jgi:hypothetical protein
MGLIGVFNLFAQLRRTFPAMAQAALFGFDFRHGHADNSLTASVCPARMAAQQDLAAQQG